MDESFGSDLDFAFMMIIQNEIEHMDFSYGQREAFGFL